MFIEFSANDVCDFFQIRRVFSVFLPIRLNLSEIRNDVHELLRLIVLSYSAFPRINEDSQNFDLKG